MLHSSSLLVSVTRCVRVSIPTPTHKSRRTLLHESSTFIAQKTKAALAQGLGIILCVGKTLAEREAERTDEVVREQPGEVVKKLSADVSGWKRAFLDSPIGRVIQ